MASKEDEDFGKRRRQMVQDQLKGRDIADPGVLQAFENVPRHRFVRPEDLKVAYDDRALALGPDQTISQPYIVAVMIEALNLRKGEKVLEIGTGSGYQTALLAELGVEVYSVELDPGLSTMAASKLRELGYKKAQFKVGDGFKGWPEHAPFDAILVSASPLNLPRELVKQLKQGGRMILPLADDQKPSEQVLVLINKTKDGLDYQDLGAVRFVPMKETE